MEFQAEEDNGGGDEVACELRKGLKASRAEYEIEHAHKEGTVELGPQVQARVLLCPTTNKAKAGTLDPIL